MKENRRRYAKIRRTYKNVGICHGDYCGVLGCKSIDIDSG